MPKPLALVFAALAIPAAAQDAPPALWANYACAGGAVLEVAYINVSPEQSFAVVGWAGKLIPMQAGPTGSGVRYIAFDEQESYRWLSKGDEGMLVFLAADHTAEEQVILSDCERIGG